mgnify:FL=1|jgi:hypothetical protein|tara:strand:- start:463 stop:666 length:204 start_codon:yes stop_codon:yes gene_type:complete
MEAYLMLSFGLVFAGACAIYFAHKQAYEKGITDAVLMHREGRLKYKDYYDDDGDRMVDIQIDPMEDE